MDKPTYKLVGSPCGHHGQYTFYKALKISGDSERIIAIGEFFFVRLWQDSELVSVGELQLLWTDRVSDQTLVSLRLYFLPENTPDGRGQHGEDEVLAISEKVVVKAEDLLSWVCDGAGWRWGLRAVWRGACAPPAAAPPDQRTAPLHHTRLDFSDVEREKSAIAAAEDRAGVVVFSYPRYCRYRALLSRLEGLQADWLRDSLVAALGGYAAPTKNTRILYCKDTFEYPELEGHEFVCNHLAPRLKGRPRGRRRRRARSRSHTPSTHSSDSERDRDRDRDQTVVTPRRLPLRNGAERPRGALEALEAAETAEDEAFLARLERFHRGRDRRLRVEDTLKDLSLRKLYSAVMSRGGFEAACRRRAWRTLLPHRPARARDAYERFLLPYENYERRNGTKLLAKVPNGKIVDTRPIDTIDVPDSPARDPDPEPEPELEPEPRTDEPTPPPPLPTDTAVKDAPTPPTKQEPDEDVVSKPAEELNREFLESLPPKDESKDNKDNNDNSNETKEFRFKITLKPVAALLDSTVHTKRITEYFRNNDIGKLFDDNRLLVAELLAKYELKGGAAVLQEVAGAELSDASAMMLRELAQKLNLDCERVASAPEPSSPEARNQEPVSSTPSSGTEGGDHAVNGHAPSAGTADQKSGRPAGKSSLRAVRVKPARPHRHHHHHHHHQHHHQQSHHHQQQPHHHQQQQQQPTQSPPAPLRVSPAPAPSVPPALPPAAPAPAPGPPPVTNFGIHHPPPAASHSDDEIVEVPYKPKTPEIIDLDEYPESPQSVKRKKLDILKERGLEVTPVPTAWPVHVAPNPITPLLNPTPIILPPVQHPIMTQAQLYQMYNIIAPNYADGSQPPRVIQATSIFGSPGPQKTVYGNPKDPFMPEPHVLRGAPLKPQRCAPSTSTPAHAVLDLTCKADAPAPAQARPAVEIVRVPTTPSPSKTAGRDLSGKNYTLVDGKAVVGSNLEITLVNAKVTPTKNRPPQKRSSNGKFVSTKTPTPPKLYTSPSPAGGGQKKPPIVIPNYQVNARDDVSPTGSTGSGGAAQTNLLQTNMLQNVLKGQNSLAQFMGLPKSGGVTNIGPYMDPYMTALYSSLGQVDPRQLAMYRDLMTNQMRSYPGLLNMGAVTSTPTTKN